MQNPTSRAETTPDGADLAPRVRVVLVTLDNHLSEALRRAERTLRKDMPGLSIVVHAAADWAEDKSALARCVADIAEGDIIIATMLFVEDHIRGVLPALQARREACDAMICAMSAAEVVRQTRSAEGAQAVARFCRAAGDVRGAGLGKDRLKNSRRLGGGRA